MTLGAQPPLWASVSTPGKWGLGSTLSFLTVLYRALAFSKVHQALPSALSSYACGSTMEALFVPVPYTGFSLKVISTQGSTTKIV